MYCLYLDVFIMHTSADLFITSRTTSGTDLYTTINS